MVDIDSLINPYWDAVKANPGDDITLRYDKRWVPTPHPPLDMIRGRSPEARQEYEEWLETYGRSALVKKYAWSIPSPDSLLWVLKALDGRPVVEIGAGTGYWASLLVQLGVDVRAYDHRPPAMGYNEWHCSRETRVVPVTQEDRDEAFRSWKIYADLRETVNSVPDSIPMPEIESPDLPDEWEREVLAGYAGEQYVDIIEGDHTALKLPENEGRVLFLSWPPYDNTMAEEVLDAYSGDTLIYIGESQGGCTGTDAFFERLGEEWIAVDEGPLTQWSGMHDYLELWVRKTAPKVVHAAVKRMRDAEV